MTTRSPSTHLDPAPGQPLSEPHHDTGSAYLTGERQHGARLTARLWVPAPRAPQRVLLRQVVDGEPVVTALERVSASGAGVWWEGEVELVNTVNRYRFLLLEPGSTQPYLWYHGAGLSEHDVPDATDFQVPAHDAAPEWVLDAVAYQVFPDRFARGPAAGDRQPPSWATPHAWLEEPPLRGDASARAWYDGDLEGVTAHLDWIQSLGADILYLTPVFPAQSVHRYDASSFEHVDELLGGDPALARRSAALHQRGMRLVLDLTTNHTGVGHEWFRQAVQDPGSPQARFYSFTQHPDVYAMWLDAPSLPKLDHRSPELRERLLSGPQSVTARWLLPPYEADGWRTDVANMTGRHGLVDLAHQVAADMRATMAKVEADTGRPLWLLAEHGHDASADLTGQGWHGTMSYTGFTRPLWSWLSSTSEQTQRLWDTWPAPVPHLPGGAVVRGLRQYNALLPDAAVHRSMNLLCSHDTPRVRTIVGGHDAQMVAATALFTAPGVPTVFSGDELGATGVTGEHSRTTIPWADDEGGASGEPTVGPRGSWGEVDLAVLERYRHLARRRRDLVALRRGGTRWVLAQDDLVAWVRTHPEGDVLVVLARDAVEPVQVPLTALPALTVHDVEAYDDLDVVLCRQDDGSACLQVSSQGPGSAIITFEAPTR